MANPREEILANPEWTILIFGDGCVAQLNGGIRRIDTISQRPVIEFLIKPGETLKKWYKIDDDMLNKNGQINYTVFESDLVLMNPYNDANKRMLYKKNYLHEDTPVSLIAWDTNKRLELIETRNAMMEGELIWAYEQLQLAKSNPAEFMVQGMELVERITSKLSEFVPQSKKSKDEFAGMI